MPRPQPATLATWDAGLGVDAVEPVPGLSRLAAVATYRLADAGAGRRAGFVHLVRVSGSEVAREAPEDDTWALRPVASTPDLSGVLDLRCVAIADGAGVDGDAGGPGVGEDPDGGPRDACCALVLAACADAGLRAFRVAATCKADGGGIEYALVPAWCWSCGEDEGMSNGNDQPIVLSVDVAPTYPTNSASDRAVAVLTTSSGSLHVVQFTATSCVSVHCISAAHSDSAWAATFVPGSSSWSGQSFPSNSTLFSGGDDATLASWDLRAGQYEPVFRLRKAHSGVGVTSLHALNRGGGGSDGSCNLLTGGYDDSLRLWDSRSMKQCVSEVECGGGIWRIKEQDVHGLSSSSKSRAFLLGCMYDGFKVVSMGSADDLTVVAAYREHNSLAYGAAWMEVRSQGVDADDGPNGCGGDGTDCLFIRDGERISSLRGRVALTGSFYDNALHLWTL
jgi:hypothetical protein